MENNFKMFIVPIILGSLGAAISFILKLSPAATVTTSLLLWMSGIFLSYKEPKLKSPQTDDMTFEEYIAYSRKATKHLQRKAREIENQELSDKISNISFNIEKLSDTLEKNPEKFTKNRKVFSYYIPQTVNLIDKYDEIEDQKLTSKTSKEYMKNVENVITTLDVAYKNILNNVYEYDILDSSADIKVLNDLLKLEGVDSE